MAPNRIEQEEIEKYWEIFSSLSQGGTYLDGAQAAPVLKNSHLRDDQLERVWDLADVDNDGKLDFEEFCVAMRLIFDLINGISSDVPKSLPDWLVPESKAHLVQATRALTGSQTAFEQVEDDDEGLGLKDGFDWYMSPSDRSKYEEIYTANRDPHGGITFDALADLFDSLDNVPDSDVRFAWNLVNPKAQASIAKDATLAFLHILNQRSEGFRVPRTVPASLRASFETSQIDYDLNSAANTKVSAAAQNRWATPRDDTTSTGRKAKFGDVYLTRLGIGDRATHYAAKGTDFSSTPATTPDWEEVRLKKLLRDLDAKLAAAERQTEAAEAAVATSESTRSKPALVKHELQLMLEYKRGVLRELDNNNDGDGDGDGGAANGLAGLKGDVEAVREQVDGLAAHWDTRREVLAGLRREIEEERAGGGGT